MFEPAMGLGVLGMVFGMVALEWAWAKRSGREVYERRETLGTLGVMAGMQVSRFLALPFVLGFHTWMSQWAWFELEAHPGTFLVALLLTDLVYYWHHRLSHEIPVLWAIHQTHHSAERLNLLAAVRLNWLGPWLIQPVLAAPLVLLGFPPTIVTAVALLDLVFQFFLHTEAIGRLPLLEGWLNTPAAHRVHHARNEDCLDRNYAGVLTIWDRLFGSWIAPVHPVGTLDYGLTSGSQGNNPFWIVFGGLVRWWRRQPI